MLEIHRSQRFLTILKIHHDFLPFGMYLCVSLNMIHVCTQEREFISERHSKHPHIRYVCIHSRPKLKLHDLHKLHKHNDGQDTISVVLSLPPLV